MRVELFGEKRRFYFIGIGGISMSALAKMLLSYGYRVCGYDEVNSRQVQILKGLGVQVSVGEDDFDRLARAEIVVYTDAIAKTDKRLQYSKEKGLLIISRTQLLSALSGGFSRVIAIAGSHGKTTCTAICTHCINQTNTPFAAHIGGEDTQFDNFTMTGADFFITEACEYKKNLSLITADSAVLLNVDRDHLECFDDVEDLKSHFFHFLERAKTGFICLDDENCQKYLQTTPAHDLVTFSCQNISADYVATKIKQCKDGYQFSIMEYGKYLCRAHLRVAGRHNIYNALAAIAVLRSYGFDEKQLVEGLYSFTGVKRRFERLDDVFKAVCVADYAHHPREISATIKMAKESLMQGKDRAKMYVVFQPHTYSRTKLLMDEFVEVLSALDNLVVYRSFAAREKMDEAGSAYTLAQKVGAIYADNVAALETYLRKTIKEGDVVLFLGAGDVYAVAQYLSRLKG